MNAQAAETGVLVGMTATQAQARCGGLRVLTRDRVEEAALDRALLSGVEAWCADLEATGSGLVTVDHFACRQWRRDWKAFGEALCQTLSRDLRLEVVMGVGPTPDLACWAAASIAAGGPVVRVLEAKEKDEGRSAADALRDEPIGLLRPSPGLLKVLELWGVKRVGQFLALSRDDVRQRLGSEAAELWDGLRGKRRRMLRLLRPATTYEQVCDLEYELEQMEPLLFLLRRGLESLTVRLAT